MFDEESYVMHTKKEQNKNTKTYLSPNGVLVAIFVEV